MKSTGQARSEVCNHGAFLSVPAAFEGGDASVTHAIKMEFATTIQKPDSSEFSFETTFSTDRMLVDFGAVLPGSIDLKRIERDCDFIKMIVQQNPSAIQTLLAAVAGENGGEPSQILEASRLMQKVGFTERAAHEEGGGFIPLLIVAAAALFVAGCQSCTAHGTAGRRPPAHP
jgi:hypothetical protein